MVTLTILSVIILMLILLMLIVAVSCGNTVGKGLITWIVILAFASFVVNIGSQSKAIQVSKTTEQCEAELPRHQQCRITSINYEIIEGITILDKTSTVEFQRANKVNPR